MTSPRQCILGLLGVVFLFSLVVVPAEAAGSITPGPVYASQEEPVVNPDGYTSARVCGECHADIYRSWKRSLHAMSVVDPVFDTAFMQAIKEGGEEARKHCLACHAPMTMMNGDYGLEQAVTTEGVSCDFCHTVTAVRLDGSPDPYDNDMSLVKRGDIKKAASPAHQVAYSELHTKSEFCGGCHNYATPGGTLLISTYDEWKRGPYPAEGIQCQNCHMVLSRGKVVDETVKKSGSRIHLHSLIHDSDQLRGALSLKIVDTRRGPELLTVEVVVENRRSGHMVPTGIPTREVILQVAIQSDGKVRTSRRRYRKVIADRKYKRLKTDHEVLLYGAHILSDNRIAPREKRTERFTFPIRRTGSIKVTATLSYQYAPALLSVRKMDIRLGETERTIP